MTLLQEVEDGVAEIAKAPEEHREEAKHLRRILDDVQQIAGKALGYPWYKDDPVNFPDATEADGVCIGEHVAETIVEELAKAYTALRDHAYERGFAEGLERAQGVVAALLDPTKGGSADRTVALMHACGAIREEREKGAA